MQAFERVRGDLTFVRGDLIHPDRAQVLRGGAEPDCLSDRRSTRLEAVGRRGIRRAGHGDHLDHLPTTQEWWQRSQQLIASPEHPDACRANHLVTSEGDQIRAERSHVHRQLRNGLRGIDDNGGTNFMTEGSDPTDRVDGAQHVRHMRHRNDLGSLVQQPLRGSLVQVEPPLVGHVEPAQHSTGTLCQELPRDDVGMVLHN